MLSFFSFSLDRPSASSLDDKEIGEIVGGVAGSVVILAVAYIIVKIRRTVRRRTNSKSADSGSDSNAILTQASTITDVFDAARKLLENGDN